MPLTHKRTDQEHRQARGEAPGGLVRGFSGSVGGTSDGRDYTVTVRLGMQPKAENNPGVTTRHSSAIFCLIDWRAGRNQPPSCGKPRRQLTAPGLLRDNPGTTGGIGKVGLHARSLLCQGHSGEDHSIGPGTLHPTAGFADTPHPPAATRGAKMKPRFPTHKPGLLFVNPANPVSGFGMRLLSAPCPAPDPGG